MVSRTKHHQRVTFNREAAGIILVESLNHGEATHRGAKPTFLMRLVAGIWFAAVFGILAAGYLAYLLGSDWNLESVIRSTDGLYRIIAPTTVGGVCGSLFGAAILTDSRRYRTSTAVLRGMLVGIVCVTSYVGFWALEGTLYGTRREFTEFVWLVTYIGLSWGWIAAVPAAIIGALGGLLLYCSRRALRRMM